MLLLLLLPLASSHLLPHTNLINGRYRYKVSLTVTKLYKNKRKVYLKFELSLKISLIQAGPYDGPATGLNQYFALWGINDTLVSYFKEFPTTEVYTVKEDGSGFEVVAIEPGVEEGDGALFDLTWHKETEIPSPLGSILDTTASLVGPNTMRLTYLAKEEGITDVQTLRFTPAGIQVMLSRLSK